MRGCPKIWIFKENPAVFPWGFGYIRKKLPYMPKAPEVCLRLLGIQKAKKLPYMPKALEQGSRQGRVLRTSRSRTDPDTAIMYRKTEPAKTAMTAAARHRHSCFCEVSVQDPEKVHGPLDLFHQCVEHLGS